VTAVELDEVPQAASVETAAAAFDKVGPAVDDFMHAVTSAWSRLAEFGVYDTPESPQVISALSDSMHLASTLGEDAGGVKAALMTYATTLADLASRRGALATDKALADAFAIAVLDGSEEDSVADSDLGGDDIAQSSVNRRLLDFNAEVAEADQTCAEALLKLLRYPGDQAVDAMQQIGAVVDDNKVALGILGTQELLRLAPSMQHLFSAIMSTDDIKGLAETYRSPLTRDVPGSLKKIFSIESLLKPFTPAEAGLAFGAADDGLSSLEKARGLMGNAGTVIAGGMAIANQWDEDEAKHPDWDTFKRVEHSAFIGGAKAAGAIVGGSVGTDVGELAGAVVGEAIFPLGGGIIGGFVGGVVGGFIGSKIGEGFGDVGSNLLDNMFK
jgi:hypothetical protein